MQAIADAARPVPSAWEVGDVIALIALLASALIGVFGFLIPWYHARFRWRIEG